MTARPASSKLAPVQVGTLESVEALDPTALGPMAEEAMSALLVEGESTNTLRSYRAALRYWAAWFALRYRRPLALPVPVPVVQQFLIDHAQRSSPAGLVSELPAAVDAALVEGGFKSALGAPSLATLQHRISVLSKAHQLQQQTNPCQDPAVRELLAKTRRAYAKRGTKQKRKPALTRDPLTEMLKTCDNTLRGLRDRAMLLFAWSSGGRRRSEVTAATCENLTKHGPGRYAYALLHSKTNQAGHDDPEANKPIVGQAGAALEAWLAASGIRQGPIFRRIRRGNHLAEALSPSAVRDIVKARAALAGLDDAFSAHSLRSGFVTEAARQGVPIGETMALTGHTSVATVVRYFRAADALGGKAARLMDEE